jgi:hypothetical protein
MANAMPCQACLEVADAEFMISNRLGVPWPFEQSTVALCVPCFIQTGIAMGEALQAAMAELEAMANPEELKQIRANEAKEVGAPAVARPNRKSRKETVPESDAPEAAQEGAPPHVNS